MNHTLYKMLRFLGLPFRYRVVGLERLPRGGPAIYIANHSGSAGPIQIVISLPQRFFPWVIAEMTDFRRAPRYLYDDFVRPELRLSGIWGLRVATFLSRIAVWLLNGIGSVPIEKEHGIFDGSLKRSLALLQEGKSLLIFPEDKMLEQDPETQVYNFRYGFGLLCQMYQQAVSKALPIYPIAVHAGRRMILVGDPLTLPIQEYDAQAIRDFCRRAQENVKSLYKQLHTKTFL